MIHAVVVHSFILQCVSRVCVCVLIRVDRCACGRWLSRCAAPAAAVCSSVTLRAALSLSVSRHQPTDDTCTHTQHHTATQPHHTRTLSMTRVRNATAAPTAQQPTCARCCARASRAERCVDAETLCETQTRPCWLAGCSPPTGVNRHEKGEGERDENERTIANKKDSSGQRGNKGRWRSRSECGLIAIATLAVVAELIGCIHAVGHGHRGDRRQRAR